MPRPGSTRPDWFKANRATSESKHTKVVTQKNRVRPIRAPGHDQHEVHNDRRRGGSAAGTSQRPNRKPPQSQHQRGRDVSVSAPKEPQGDCEHRANAEHHAVTAYACGWEHEAYDEEEHRHTRWPHAQLVGDVRYPIAPTIPREGRGDQSSKAGNAIQKGSIIRREHAWFAGKCGPLLRRGRESIQLPLLPEPDDPQCPFCRARGPFSRAGRGVWRPHHARIKRYENVQKWPSFGLRAGRSLRRIEAKAAASPAPPQ